MHMKFLKATFLVSILAGTTTAAHASSDGIIEIDGRIVATTCLIEGKPPGSGAATKAITLGDISVGALSAEKQTAGDRGFVIHIGGNDECTDGVAAKVRFDPSSSLLDHGSGRLNVDQGAGAATNVQIEIANGDGKAINMYSEDSQGVTIAGHGAEIPLIARYYANGKVTEGDAKSRINFQVVYE